MCALVLLMPGLLGAASDPAERRYRSERFEVIWEENSGIPAADLNGNGVPDAIESLAEAHESAFDFLTGPLGFAWPRFEPPYELYVSAATDRAITQVLPSESKSRKSVIVVPTRAIAEGSDPGELIDLAVHEVLHAIQMSYDVTEPAAMRESTAMWAQALFDPSRSAHLRHLPDFLDATGRSFFETDGDREYGAFLFPQFLMERYAAPGDPAGPIRRWWELAAAPDGLPGAPDLSSHAALAAMLAENGTTIEDAWLEFSLWQRELNRFRDGAVYSAVMEEAGWPRVAGANEVRAESCAIGTAGDMASLSTEYRKLTLTKNAQPGEWLFAARGDENLSGYLQVKERKRPPITHRFEADEPTSLQLNPRRLKRVIVILSYHGDGDPELAPAFSLRRSGASTAALAEPSVPVAVSYGFGTQISGSVTCGGAPASDARLVVQETERISGVTRTYDVLSGDRGEWSLRTSPERNVTYTVTLEDPLYAPATSAPKPMDVQLFVTIEVEPAGSPLTQNVRGTVSPGYGGVALAVEARRPGGIAWRRLGQTTTAPDGSYDLQVAFPADGVWFVRTVSTDTADPSLSPGRSTTRLLEVN